MFASEKGHLEIVRELCERGANVNAAQTDEFGWSVLMCASAEGHLSVVQYLLDHGANKTAVNSSGINAHDLASDTNKALLQDLLRP
jgi:ankyrin repeat protein